MDSLFAWDWGGGSDELLKQLGRMTLLFTAVDECITAAIQLYIQRDPSLSSVLKGIPLSEVPVREFMRKRKWLKDILCQTDSKQEGQSDVLAMVRDVTVLNAARRDYTHGLVRLKRTGELTFRNQGNARRASDIEKLNKQLEDWLGRFWGFYTVHGLSLGF